MSETRKSDVEWGAYADTLIQRIGALTEELAQVKALEEKFELVRAAFAEAEEARVNLTEELESVTAERDALTAKVREMREVISAVQKAVTQDVDQQFHYIRDWMDARNIYNGNLSDLYVIDEALKAALRLFGAEGK